MLKYNIGCELQTHNITNSESTAVSGGRRTDNISSVSSANRKSAAAEKSLKEKHLVAPGERRRPINRFEKADYVEGIKKYPIRPSLCKVVTALKVQCYDTITALQPGAQKSPPTYQESLTHLYFFRCLQPSYTVCTHHPKKDVHVSAVIQSGRAWEAELSRLLGKMLNTYGRDSVLLDLGSNIGAHSLYAASLGHHVWAVEALTMNHVKVSISRSCWFCIRYLNFLS